MMSWKNISLYLIAHASLSSLLASQSFGSNLPFDVQPSCFLHLRGVLAQTLMLCLESIFCNLYPIVSSSLLICSSMIHFAVSVIFEAWPLPVFWESPCFFALAEELQNTNFKWLCVLLQSSRGWFPHSSSPITGSIESSASQSENTIVADSREQVEKNTTTLTEIAFTTMQGTILESQPTTFTPLCWQSKVWIFLWSTPELYASLLDWTLSFFIFFGSFV